MESRTVLRTDKHSINITKETNELLLLLFVCFFSSWTESLHTGEYVPHISFIFIFVKRKDCEALSRADSSVLISLEIRSMFNEEFAQNVLFVRCS